MELVRTFDRWLQTGNHVRRLVRRTATTQLPGVGSVALLRGSRETQSPVGSPWSTVPGADLAISSRLPYA